MTRATAPNQPTVEEMLVSIRQAIHGGNAKPAPSGFSNQKAPLKVDDQNGNSVSGSMREMRVNLNRPNTRKNAVSKVDQDKNFRKLREQLHEMGATARETADTLNNNHGRNFSAQRVRKGAATGFAGILSGDLRLEEALRKLKQAGLQSPGGKATQQMAEARESRTQPIDAGGLRQSDVHEEDIEYVQGDDYDQSEIQTHPLDQGEQVPVQEPQSTGFSDYTRETYLTEQEVLPIERAYLDETYAPAPMAPEMPIAPQGSDPNLPLAPSAPIASPPLTSHESSAATSAAFERLTDAIVGHASTGERSIDEITRELLRPMLQSWLDENLPPLAERLVREEIERVARWGNK